MASNQRVKIHNRRNKVLAYLERYGPSKFSDIMDEFDSGPSIGSDLTMLVRGGCVERIGGRGTYKIKKRGIERVEYLKRKGVLEA